MENIERTRINSSAIAEIGYDENSMILEVTFNRGSMPKNVVYQYSNVPKSVFDEIMKADSKGTFFRQNIRDQYTYVCVDV